MMRMVPASARRAILQRPLFAALLFGLIGSLNSCQPSEFLRKEEVTYNFEDEGFLDRRTLQTLAEARIRLREYGLEAASSRCMERAVEKARRRALRAMLHVSLEIPPASGERTSQPEFERDFPASFTSRDMIRAEIDLRPLLERGYIALQDKRSRESCSVVYRIEARGDDLPSEIRAQRLTFEPENRPWLERGKRAQDRLADPSSGGEFFPSPEAGDPRQPDAEKASDPDRDSDPDSLY